MRPAAALALTLAAAAGAAVGPACSRSEANVESTLARPANDTWKGPSLAEVTLLERSGRELALRELRGRPLVMDFVFTTCSGPCPKLSANMQRLQAELAGTGVRLVSVTVDPLNDGVEALTAYAQRFGADKERWLFLTGEESAIHELVASVHLAVQREPGAPPGAQVTHATRLVVVDAQGAVRGYYNGLTDGGLAAAAARARFLDRESR